jgi:NADH dehydrogenase (ubiquinone) 1 alpha subcomplex subunit 9
VGRYVTALLAAGGTQVIVPYRGDDMEWRHLKVNGDLGVVTPIPFSPKNNDSIKRAIEGSDIVINCIGKDYETKHYLPFITNFSFEDVHIKIPETIAKASVELGVTNFIHLSALASDPYALSKWSRTKALGEQAVRAVAPGSTIVRPADVFGTEDRFLNLLAQLHKSLGRVPLVDGGKARVQPLYVQDLVQALFKIAVSEDPEVMLGQTYDLAGPEEYTYREVVEYVFETIRAVNPEVANLSPTVADAAGSVLGLIPFPLITTDRFRRMQVDTVLDDLAPTKRLHDLGIEATSMEMPGFTFLHRFRVDSHLLDLKPGQRWSN